MEHVAEKKQWTSRYACIYITGNVTIGILVV